MSIIVEDGTGKTNSNSYISVDDFKTYWSDRGEEFTGVTPEVIATWLIRGTDFIDAQYLFLGYPTSADTQSLQWPRKGVRDTKGVIIDDDEIPKELLQAICLIGKEVRTVKDLSSKVDTGVSSKKIGPVSTSYKSGYVAEYKSVSNALGSLVRSGRPARRVGV